MTHLNVEIIEQFARLDPHREKRTGIPEAVFAEGKSCRQVIAAVRRLAEKSGSGLATRVEKKCAKEILKTLKVKFQVHYNAIARTVVVASKKRQRILGGTIAVLAAGTSDLPVAEEAKVTAEMMGCTVLAYYDVGIAGIHRLLDPLREIHLQDVAALVVVAGMEGALPSVVRGLVAVPVIGVPTSTGYGFGGQGKGALMTMLQSCAPGLTVVNIDNGFGAGATAALIANRLAAASREKK
ncbi:MAG: nickel pincer cofactor biosynthesis protein LarB [bacterium]